MNMRSVVAHGLLLLSIGVMAAGCAHTDTKISTQTALDSTPGARGTGSTPVGAGTQYYANNPTKDAGESPGPLAQAEKLTPESEADMARAMLFFPVFGVRIPVW
jgi:hypothetical protein